MSIISISQEPRRGRHPVTVSRFGHLAAKHYPADDIYGHCTLSLILEGDGCFALDGVEQRLRAPCAFLCRAGRRYRYVPDTVWDEVCFSLASDWNTIAHAWGVDDPAPLPWPIGAPSVVSAMARQIDRLLSSVGMPGVADSVDALAAALFWASRSMEADVVGDTTSHRIAQLAQHWRQHPADPRSLEQTAAYIGLSAVHLRRLWHQHFGCSPQVWRQRQRLLQAEDLLIATNRSIATIAAELGFEHPRNFAAVFRRAYGVAPAAWRRRSMAD